MTRSGVGIVLALAGTVILSVNDLAIKALSDAYALHQVILFRTVVGMAVVLMLMALSRGGMAQMRTARPLGHLVRVAFVMVSNVAYFLGLAALPLADAVAVAFVAPLIVTVLSALVLGEPVGPRRWAAVVVGLVGVLIMVRPGAGVFQPAAVLILISAFTYAASHLMTRHLRATESAVTLSFYVQCGFVVVSCLMGLFTGGGQFAGSADASLAFLFRPWHWPAPGDLWAFVATGVAVSVGGLMISEAYRRSEAAAVAPLEYIGMPMAILWGWVAFGTLPDLWGWVGIGFICGAGLYTLWRETRHRREVDVAASPGSDL